MQSIHLLAGRDSPDRPQRFGILPTQWFWREQARHRREWPLVLSLSLPLMPALFFLVVRFQLPFSLFVVVNALVPYLVMGLIERRRRARDGTEAGAALVRANHDAWLALAPARTERRSYLVLAAASGAALVPAVGGLWGAGPAALSGLALILLLAAASGASFRAPSLPRIGRRH